MPLPFPEPDQYRQRLQAKCQRVSALFEGLQMPSPTVYPSPDIHFRQRCEFRIWHSDGRRDYVMFDPEDPRTPIPLEQFAVASEDINDLMPKLMAALDEHALLHSKLFQIEFLGTLSGDMLVTLIYHKPLSDEWQELAQTLETQLDIAVIGRSRKQKRVLSKDYVTERLSTTAGEFQYRQYEGGFTQPNARVNTAMLDWALKMSQHGVGDLLELYCGNGNFTLPLSTVFPKVFATEISKTSIQALRENCELNSRTNITVARLSAEELTSALQGEREFRRLRDIELAEFDLQTVFVDPPRAGLDPATRSFVEQFPVIMYISCNPETLQRDLRALPNHQVAAFAMFDQFPYTDHMECGCLLTRI